MSEMKRISLQEIVPDIGFQTTDIASQGGKKNEKDKVVAPSFRFELNLFESNEEKCPEFNYANLLKGAEKKKKKDKRKDENNGSNGINSLDDDNNEKVLDIARYYESKYGKRKKSDYVDVGAGYDESDSFIDNTDAYDELVPEEVTTVLGGFYINSGPLEFKNLDNAKNLHRKHSNDKENGQDDDDDDDDEDEEDDEDEDEDDDEGTSDESDDAQISKKKVKRTLSSSDIEETEESAHSSKKKANTEEAECTVVD